MKKVYIDKDTWFDADADRQNREFMKELEEHVIQHWADLFPWLDKPCDECKKLNDLNNVYKRTT